MFLDRGDRVVVQALVVFGIKVRLIELSAIDKYVTIPYLHGLAWKANYPLYITLFRIGRVPKNHNVASLQMAPAYALDSVIDKLVDQEPLAVVQLRQHGCALDNHRLDKENT